MDRRFRTNHFVTDPDGPTTPENGPDSPLSGDDIKISTMPSHKKSRRSIQKKVVSVRISDLDGSRTKGEGYPPSDSWAWRKYGQKPIKGSPYPRGYYRCSSSKGCPAKKQVERNPVDPSTLIITYACDHDHPLIVTKHHASTPTTATAAASITTTTTSTTATAFQLEELAVFANQPDLELDDKNSFPDLPDEFAWFSDTGPVLDNSFFWEFDSSIDNDVTAAVVIPMGEEEESLFADLGELPGCSVVFRRSVDEHHRRWGLR